MDPIGTITCYFPFIDAKTKSVLEEKMTEARDYYDFVHQMGDLVLNNDCSIMVVYFAIHHSILASEYKLIDMIREKYGEYTLLGPNLFISSAFQGSVEDVKKVHELADEILASDPEDWIQLEMNFMKFEADMRNYPKTIYKTTTMNRIRELIDNNPDFGFYEIILDDYLSIRAHTDGDNKERLRCLNRGIQLAEKYDEKLRKADLLIKKAYFIKDHDVLESRALLEEAYHITDTALGIPVYFSEVIETLGVIDSIRGEFDSAIRRWLQAVSIRERAGLNSGNASSYLSIFYNMVSEPESGLEWAQMAEDQYKSRPYMINRAILYQAWSLLLLKRITEAQVLLDTSRESILKSGDESQLAWLHFVTGVLEIDQGNLSLASSSIEQALQIYESQGWGYQFQLIFLHHLAKIEVYSCSSENDVTPSLAILEDKAKTDDLPGYIGQVLVLQAEIALIRNDEAELRDIIQKLRPLTEKDSMHFLKPFYENLLRKV